jgi:hypothetical protein
MPKCIEDGAKAGQSSQAQETNNSITYCTEGEEGQGTLCVLAISLKDQNL